MIPRCLLACSILILLAAGCTPVVVAPTTPPPTDPSGTPLPPASSEPSPTSSPTTTAAPSSPAPTASVVATAFDKPSVKSKAGRLELSAVLTADGAGLGGAPVTLTITARGNTYQTLTLKGVVPRPAKSLIVQLGFNNQPDTGPESYDVRFYRITYADGGPRKNRLPNGGFDSGLYHWAVYGTGKVTTPKSDMGDGRLLRLRAAPSQEVVINSYGIAVKPGSAYTMTVTARVPPAGSTSGYVAAIFLDEIEIWRETLKVVGAPIPDARSITDAAGGITFERALPPGDYVVTLSYPGDAGHMPATLEQEVTVGQPSAP